MYSQRENVVLQKKPTQDNQEAPDRQKDDPSKYEGRNTRTQDLASSIPSLVYFIPETQLHNE